MIPLKVFCDTRYGCESCRDPANTEWRAELSQVFVLPPDAPDFECPYGLKWGQGNAITAPKSHAAPTDNDNSGPDYEQRKQLRLELCAECPEETMVGELSACKLLGNCNKRPCAVKFAHALNNLKLKPSETCPWPVF